MQKLPTTMLDLLTLYLAWTTNVAHPAVFHNDITYTDFDVRPFKQLKIQH